MSDEAIEGMVAWLKEKVANSDDEDLDALIDEGEEKFGVSLTDEEQEQLKELLRKLSSLDLDLKSLKEQAQSIYNKLDDMGIHISSEDAHGIIQKLIALLKSFLNK